MQISRTRRVLSQQEPSANKNMAESSLQKISYKLSNNKSRRFATRSQTGK